MNAAFANAILARARELDDALEMLPFHASAVMIPVALAMAEQGGNLSGKDFIAAVSWGSSLPAEWACLENHGSQPGSCARSVWGPGSRCVGARISGFKKEDIGGPGDRLPLGGGSELPGGDSSMKTLWLGCGIDALQAFLPARWASAGLTGPAGF